MKPVYLKAIPDHARWLHTSRFDIRWGDMDAFGHVNNSSYFTYFEQTRIDWLRAIGYPHDLVLANIGCTFFKGIVYPAVIDVKLFAANPGRTSLDTYYEIRDANNEAAGTVYTVGHGVLVWYDHTAGRPVELPEAIRAAVTGPAG